MVIFDKQAYLFCIYDNDECSNSSGDDPLKKIQAIIQNEYFV